MSAILYPIADNAETALHSPLGYAAWERTAAQVADGRVTFVTEAVGPAFETREAALDAYAGRVEDERPGRAPVPVERRWCSLRPVSAGPARRKPVQPVCQDGRRWPTAAPGAAATLWRLSVSYWRVAGAEAESAPLSPARKLRRDPAEGPALDGAVLRRLSLQPLRAVEPQQPLDVGLFEVRPPEAPHILMPDE